MTTLKITYIDLITKSLKFYVVLVELPNTFVSNDSGKGLLDYIIQTYPGS